MPFTLNQRMDLIKDALNNEKNSVDPLFIARKIMKQNFVSINGPEHHMLDGGAFLVAYKNAGGTIDLPKALDELEKRALTMPGATCGLWGVCGSAASVGAALSIIHGTSPLSNDEYYKDNMRYTSLALSKIAAIGGPRCCKRNAILSISTAVDFANKKYGTKMTCEVTPCDFYDANASCIKEKCPFYPREKSVI
jgi:hypothetical protein